MFRVSELLKATKGRLASGKKNTAATGISLDSRTIKAGEAFISIKGNNFDGHAFIGEAVKRGAKAVITQSLNYPITQLPKDVSFIQVKDTTKALGDIARSQREKFDLPVIAVTGSNGKTTAKEMIAWVLSKEFKVLKNEGTKNNHIGLPQTLLALDSSYDFAVLEAGTNHPGEIEYLAKICRPNIGVITNIGHSHLEFLKDLKGVYREKCSLLKYLRKPNVALLNADDALLKNRIDKKEKGVVTFSFGIKNRADFFASDIRRDNGKIEFSVNAKFRFTLNALGYHNIYNALIAISTARLLGLEYGDIAGSLASFSLPQNRLNLIELKKIKFINDTYNSNPVSLKQALDALHNFRVRGRKIFIMGDMLELGPQKESFHYQVGSFAAGICDVLVTVGELSKKAAQGARESGFKNIFVCATSLEARDILFKKIAPCPEDVVLVKGSRSMKMEEVLNF
jgi:UDP-N-acetylmuramoyl-tripeptide--D-alanyl-D-alanine ligase